MQFFLKKVNKLNGGFTLVETLVALSIFSVSILGLMSVLSQGISDTTYAKKKIIAAYLAQEGIEYVRNMRDNYVLYPVNGTWVNFKARLQPCNLGNECGFNNLVLSVDPNFIFKCSTGDCKLYINNGSYNTNAGGIDSGFIRKIWMDQLADGLKIYSAVFWTQSSKNQNVVFSESLFNWVE